MLPYFILVLVCFFIKLEVSDAWNPLPYGSCTFCRSINLNRDVKFHLYTRQNPLTSYILEFKNETNLANSQFHPEYPTIIYIHGYTESASSKSSTAIFNAYLQRNIYNVILVDWVDLAASPYYPYAVENTEIVGQYLAQFVNWLESQKRIDMEALHVIGFSLGAHVAGFMAKNLAPKKIDRITGLDPASPLFPNKNISCRLDKTDATFVDIIHTSTKTGGFGIRESIGHVDFYPNQGLNQPGCELDSDGANLCSHRRAWNFYVESVLKPYGFAASRCRSLQMMSEDNCYKSNDAFMGFGVERKTRGIFTLKTNSKPPFATDFSEYMNSNEHPNKEVDPISKHRSSKRKGCKEKSRNKMVIMIEKQA
ncbi:hypothetical protein PV327_004676 [Microctonus hyperodae]|uniref:phospholipase A1 n=1 Tax=Microctonus hyperodae TaxID=165561 RepID=A0AA39FD73_MICHY|nr:hypothetical protein PV327_004676 [Microctonus hyperodae]